MRLLRTSIFLGVLAVSSIASAQSQAAKPAPVAKCTVLPQPGSDCAMTGGRATAIRVARVGVELVLGTLFGAGLGALGAYAGLNADLASGNEAGVGLGLGTSFGVALGVAPGVWLGGRMMGGDGSFGWTLLGGAVGTAISASILAVDSRPGLLFLGGTIPVSLSILAFELSAHVRRSGPPPKISIMPTIGPRSIGVVGAF